MISGTGGRGPVVTWWWWGGGKCLMEYQENRDVRRCAGSNAATWIEQCMGLKFPLFNLTSIQSGSLLMNHKGERN